MEILSFQGISDAVALGYMAEHGGVRWADIAEALAGKPSCVANTPAECARACRRADPEDVTA
jgi:hypothetical protein